MPRSGEEKSRAGLEDLGGHHTSNWAERKSASEGIAIIEKKASRALGVPAIGVRPLRLGGTR